MKRNILFLIAVSVGMTSCIVTTPVVTKQPSTVVVKQPATVVVKQPATTVVTPPAAVTTQKKTVYVNATSDLSYDLDLQAVAIAFAEARTLEEFEWFLNDYTRQISNLDLNRDGYVDYLRVVEQIYSGTHLIIIQDVYAMNACQDVATIVVENTYYTQIVGDPYFYGTNYIIEPKFVSRPAIYSQWGANYKSWNSPYYWNHYPSAHQHHAPKPQQTYYSHIDIYITNHYYCSDFGYADTYHYNNYPAAYQTYRRNDYDRQYPDQSFDSRLTTVYNGTRATNARQLTGTRDINSTRTISSRGKSSTSTSGTRASSTKSSTTSHTANSTTTTTTRTSGNTTRSNSTTRMVDGNRQITTQTRVQSSPTQTKTTTTTTIASPTSTSTRKVTTTTKTNRTTGQVQTRSNVTERSNAVTNRATNNQTTSTRAAKTSTTAPASSSAKTSTRSRANENNGVSDSKTRESQSTNSSTRTRR